MGGWEGGGEVHKMVILCYLFALAHVNVMNYIKYLHLLILVPAGDSLECAGVDIVFLIGSWKKIIK